MYWKRVVWEVLNKEKESIQCFFIFVKREEEALGVSSKMKKSTGTRKTRKKKKVKRYVWMERDHKTYLSCREEQCVSWVSLGKTLYEISVSLNLSVRTIEFYIKNIKSKLRCHTREQLLKMILSSNFWEDHILLLKDEMKLD
jgi:DNA-binding CsgD family transcriptional regulator